MADALAVRPALGKRFGGQFNYGDALDGELG